MLFRCHVRPVIVCDLNPVIGQVDGILTTVDVRVGGGVMQPRLTNEIYIFPGHGFSSSL